MNATADHQANAHDASLAGARAWFAEKGLSRPREGRILAGVVAAYTRRYDLNPLVGRILGIVGDHHLHARSPTSSRGSSCPPTPSTDATPVAAARRLTVPPAAPARAGSEPRR